MTSLSREQRKLLTRLLSSPLSSLDGLPENQLSALAYLRQVGYIENQTTSHTSNLPNGILGFSQEISHIVVSEKGKAYLYEYRVTLLCFMLPTAISLASLVISIFALFLK